MDTRPPPAPPASTRPKNSASPSTASHAPSSSQQPAAMPSSSKTVRGSTPTASRSSTKLTEGDKPARPSSKDSLKQKMAKKPEEAPRPSKSDEQLKALRADFDGLRSHLTCKICDRLLYEPYIISCGHTYCYSCLCTWFLNNKARKTCPDCRIVVTQPPAPAYVIREMTLIFVNRAEVLPAGETLEQHARWQKEEADAVQLDKNNKDPKTGGLFRGCFRAPRSAPPIRALRDQEDGVDRCPICTWELEDAECPQCGLAFDDNGELTWGDSFTGFSDMDETSERDLSGEDLDADLDMDDPELGYDAYDEEMEGWQDYLGDEGSFMMRRFLANAGAYGRRRPMTHSEAGSRRSYSQSIVSEIYTDEMDTVEEEDEEGLEEDSSMNDFIEDDEPEPATSRAASSTPGATPQPTARPPASQRRTRRIVESEASSSIGSVPEEENEDEDEEDEGPIRPGRRNRNAAQTRVLNRANGVRRPIVPPSSASEASVDQDLDEHTRRLLQEEGWMLQHDGPDDDMDEDEDDDSDGGRTTVGWDATAISNDRVRMGGSLTPTADRPRPNAPIRPPSRVGNPRIIDTSRGLRRRSSVLSSSTAHYEDGEADDDDSDIDQDADITMTRAMNSLRSRRSQAQIRQAMTFPNPNSRFVNRGFSQGDAIVLDADDNSDDAQAPGARRRTPRTRPPEYDPRISWMFANHQRDLQGSLVEQEPRSTTPLARPRTANRNRPSPAQIMSPFMPPAPSRLHTPLMNNSANGLSFSRGPTSPQTQGGNFPSIPITTSGEGTLSPTGRTASVASTGSASSGVMTPSSSTSSQPSANAISQAQAAAAADLIDRPPSRISARPPSANGRRNSSGFSPVYPGFPHPNVGLNIGGRIFQAGNPWGAFVQPHNGVRPRGSRAQLREQSSTATLRAVNSRVNIRDGSNPAQGMRSPQSRINLRAQPSRRHLNSQASTRTLRASEQARPPPSPTTNAGPTASPVARPARFTPDERDRRVDELINNRMRNLVGQYQPRPAPARTNPWRPSTSPEVASASGGPNATQHVRTNSNESVGSIGSSGAASALTVAPSQSNLNRRRSRRDIGAATASAFPITQATFSPPATTYPNYLRARQGSMTGTQTYESPFNANNRGMSPMVAAGNSGLL